jgi:photosystem II stability/assembly factor-like uncharacterized protein/sugar lactone lactonase YvrE
MIRSYLILTAIVLFSISSAVCVGTDLDVVDMSFVDDSHGWLAVMEPSPAIFKTTDAGRSWKRITVPGFYRISFFDRTTGIAIQGVSDSEFVVHRTTDGGEHWHNVATVKEKYLHAVAAGWAGAEDAFVIGEGSGGRGWVGQLGSGKPLRVRTDLPADFTGQSNTLGIFGDGAGHMWIVGKQLVLHSADKGKTWENQYENTVPNIDMGMSGSAVRGGKAWFTAANWEIYRTEDYGKHWVRSLDAANEGVNFNSVSFYNANNGCAVGNSAFAFCTRDGGLTWSRSKAFKTFLVGSPDSSKIELFASGRGWAVVAGKLYRTEDAAQNFVEMSANGSVQHSNANNLALQTSVNGPTSLAYDRAHGYLYIVAWEQQQLLRLDVKTGQIQAVISRNEDERRNDFSSPHSVAVDPQGNVFLGEFTGRIRFLDVPTGAWSVLVDEPAQNIDHFTPEAITVDKSGELLVTANHRILRYRGHGLEPFIGFGRGFSGDGAPASDAAFQFPQGLAVSEAGDIYVADRENCRIRKIDHEKQMVSTIAGTGDCDTSGDNGPAVLAKLHWPESLVIDARNNLFFIDGNRVRRIDANGTISTYAGTGEPGFSGDNGPAEKAKLNNPSGLALDENGNLYVAEFVSNRIRRVDAGTHTITTVAGNGLPHRIDAIM